MKSGSQLTRACDRCHAVKERCRWIAGSSACERCARLQHVCRNNRPVKKAGRRPRPSPQPENPSSEAAKSISTYRDISSFELQLLDRAFADELIEEFVVGPSFCESHRQLMFSQITTSKMSLEDAFLACAISWVGDTDGQPDKGQLETCYRRASSAVSTLRSLDISNTHQMSHCLALGCLIVTFALKLRVYDRAAICCQTLSLIKPVYESQQHLDPDEVAFLPCLIVIDLVDCLLQCRVPTLRYKTPGLPTYVDRYVGLCHSLLPHFHDICELSHALAHADQSDLLDIHKALDALELTVVRWQPSVPSGFSQRFMASEVAHMLCQVQVLRTAALLVLHRLRFHFGSNDSPAQVMSTSILTQLETTFQVTEKAVRYTELAFLVACFELQTESERKYWLGKISIMVCYSKQFREYVERIISSFWATMDASKKIFWYNVHESLTEKMP